MGREYYGLTFQSVCVCASVFVCYGSNTTYNHKWRTYDLLPRMEKDRKKGSRLSHTRICVHIVSPPSSPPRAGRARGTSYFLSTSLNAWWALSSFPFFINRFCLTLLSILTNGLVKFSLQRYTFTSWIWVFSTKTRPLNPREKPCYPLTRRLGGPRASLFCSFEPRTVQLVALSLYRLRNNVFWFGECYRLTILRTA